MISANELARLFDPERPRLPTAEQQAIIEAPCAPAAVIAGAGSGKTETMATRVVWLVANGHVAPERVLGLTFTRKAAAELAERVRARLARWRTTVEGPVPAGEPTVLTYAAYAGRLVAEHAVRLGEEPAARLLSAAASWQIARDVVGRWAGTAPEGFGTPATVVQRVMALSGRIADHLIDPAAIVALDAELVELIERLPSGRGGEYPKSSGEFRSVAAKRAALVPLITAFGVAKRQRGARDFADEMVLAAQLAEVDVVSEAERARYGAVLLDEYQDTGYAQVEMLRRLFADGHPVMAVGDPMQSIYGWRGASTGTMAGFADTFRTEDGQRAQVHTLTTSWRNDRAVLAAANAVADPLHGGTDAAASLVLTPRPGAGPGRVQVAWLESVVAEAGWVGRELADAWSGLPADGPRTAAVLVRKRSQIPLLEQALREQGLPVEVVDLGGLLTVPEVADVYATLQVVADHTAGAALMRLLTGARWRIGVRDLQALQQRARQLLDRATRPTPAAVGPGGFEPGGGTAAGTPGEPHGGTGVGTLGEPRGGSRASGVSAVASVPAPPADLGADPVREATHLVEALDELGQPSLYSATGYARLSALRDELRVLRSRAAAPLPELVADVERTIGMDVEVAARPDTAGRPDRGRVHLDRFLAEVTRFADEVDHATLTGFLAFLAAAEDEENGLGAGEVVVDADRVQILTVHGAKGLEWDVVAVPGLASNVFPGNKVDDDWVRSAAYLPDPIRGDADHIPHLRVEGIGSRNEFGRAREEYHDDLAQIGLDEERRLAYVAVTRARSTLLASGYLWDHTIKARTPSPFLTEIAAVPGTVVDPDWVDAGAVAVNPLAGAVVSQRWPVDPLGSRRADVEYGAALVRAALAQGAQRSASAAASERAVAWARDAELLLAEREQQAEGTVVDVALPVQLSVSQLVALQRNPQAVARALRRRMPTPPNVRARRGTAFHEWLEQRWLPRAQALLDVDELPGAADESVTDSGVAELAALREAFERSAWAPRVPAAVEVPFEMVVGARVVRGRMDAVFADGTDDHGADRWVVVDWKTGPPPDGAAARASAVQLAAYRLAWAALQEVPVDRVDAAFHYVAADLTVRPRGLLDEAGLRLLLERAGDASV